MEKGGVNLVEIPERYIDQMIGSFNPVVLITTVDSQGRVNAAPISMCMQVCHEPPLIAFSIGFNKDTYQNIQEQGEFVVNVPGKEILKELLITATRFPPEINELEEAKLTPLSSKKVKPPRIGECKLHFECQREWMKEAGDHLLVVGKAIAASAHKGVITKDYRLRVERLGAVHLLGRRDFLFFALGRRFDFRAKKR